MSAGSTNCQRVVIMKLSVRAWKESRPGTLEDAHRFARIATWAAFTDTSLRLILPVEIQSCAFGWAQKKKVNERNPDVTTVISLRTSSCSTSSFSGRIIDG